MEVGYRQKEDEYIQNQVGDCNSEVERCDIHTMVSVLTLKKIPKIMDWIALEGPGKCNSDSPGNGQSDKGVVDDVKSADGEDSPVEKEHRELDNAQTNRPQNVKYVFCLFVDQ